MNQLDILKDERVTYHLGSQVVGWVKPVELPYARITILAGGNSFRYGFDFLDSEDAPRDFLFRLFAGLELNYTIQLPDDAGVLVAKDLQEPSVFRSILASLHKLFSVMLDRAQAQLHTLAPAEAMKALISLTTLGFPYETFNHWNWRGQSLDSIVSSSGALTQNLFRKGTEGFSPQILASAMKVKRLVEHVEGFGDLVKRLKFTAGLIVRIEGTHAEMKEAKQIITDHDIMQRLLIPSDMKSATVIYSPEDDPLFEWLSLIGHTVLHVSEVVDLVQPLLVRGRTD